MNQRERQKQAADNARKKLRAAADRQMQQPKPDWLRSRFRDVFDYANGRAA